MKKNPKIIIVDSFSTNSFHETFNTAFLLGLKKNRSQTINYYASNSAIQAIKKLLNANKISQELKGVCFSKLNVYKGTSSIAIFLRYVLGVFINLKRLSKASKKDIIIFTIMNPFFIWPLQLFLFFNKRNVYVICHGELELVLKASVIYKPIYLYKKAIHSFLTYGKINKQIKLLLLGGSIQQNLIKLYPKLSKEQLPTIDHPCIFTNNLENRNSQEKKELLTLGTVGAISREKGFENLVVLSQKINKNTVNINVVGGHSYNMADYKNLNFVSKGGLQLPTDLYVSEINKLDFVLFFFSKDNYKLTASGAILDAINLNKPIIAIKNNYFENIFSLYGSIGFLCENVNQMAILIQKIATKQYETEQIEFYVNLEKLKKHYSYKNIALQLDKII